MVTFKSKDTGKYCRWVQNTRRRRNSGRRRSGDIECDHSSAGSTGKFTVEIVDEDKNLVSTDVSACLRFDMVWCDQFAMKQGGKYCADEGNRVNCNRNKIGGWEKFEYGAGY